MKFEIQREIGDLLKKNISKGQMLGYAAANLVGLTVILAGILFYADCRHSAAEDDAYFSDDYVVVSKKVEGVGFEPVSFSDEEIEKLGQQNWVRKIGRFTASQFAVNASVNIGGRGMSTYLFFESVPDEFFDVKPRNWHFDPQERFVPIMVSKDYLTLYNFGFAIPQGLPQVSESVVGAISVTLQITGRENETELFDAAVVGFSSRLNTIAVPQDFMDWANKRYAPQETRPASRLIVKTDKLAAEEIKRYLEQEELEIAGDKDTAWNISKFLRVMSGVVSCNGVLISLLALFILTLSVFLLLQKSRETIRKLMFLGFTPREIARYYERLVTLTNLIITVAAVAVACCSRMLWQEQLQDIGLGSASVWPVLLTATVYLLLVTAFNIYVIRKRLYSIWTLGK